MEDIIIRLVNEAADARKEKYENDLAYIKKTTAVDANAMGILSYLMDHYFQTDDEKQNLLYNHVRLVYSWLDYSSALPIKMFIEVGSGDRIWRNFRNLYDLYIKDNSTLTFVEWMAETEKKTNHAG
ncbi:MAG: hypothetical protein EBR82_57185 [Caulobacteraceae bacterium]|nr:hypothetical protein [Caulobacteraceae bacterium]